MRRCISFKTNDAVSEIVGGLILILIALITFSAIYMYLFPDLPLADPNVKLVGYVNNDGYIVLEHIGGESLSKYSINISYPNGTSAEANYEKWCIGEIKYPQTSMPLLTVDDWIQVNVYTTDNEGDKQQVFEGVLYGKTVKTSVPPVEDPMLISSLRTNTVDEDLICFNYPAQQGQIGVGGGAGDDLHPALVLQ